RRRPVAPVRDQRPVELQPGLWEPTRRRGGGEGPDRPLLPEPVPGWSRQRRRDEDGTAVLGPQAELSPPRHRRSPRQLSQPHLRQPRSDRRVARPELLQRGPALDPPCRPPRRGGTDRAAGRRG